ncbi:hypothetical protein [Methylovulum psychrotolerans]|uniref:hypothetical protein n=1 Tax=Methylovulum psychrotolerans TaxID=1704499 RepID=UPI0012FCF6A8|nr:hypothetical protein [Methylovulum psychrotolerans]
MASKAEAAKHDAYADHDKAELAAEEMKSATVATKGIERRFNETNSVLTALNDRFIPLLSSLTALVLSNTNYSTYSEADKKGVFMAASIAKTIKSVMETPLVNDDGGISHDSEKVINVAEKTLASLVELEPLDTPSSTTSATQTIYHNSLWDIDEEGYPEVLVHPGTFTDLQQKWYAAIFIAWEMGQDFDPTTVDLKPLEF